MFVGPRTLAAKAGDAIAGGHTAPDHGIGAEIPTKDKVNGLIPNPQFTSNGSSPICMDPGRVMLYRSLGHISGLAVRTGVPLPLSHLSAKWWMHVSHSVRSSVRSSSAVESDRASRATSEATGDTRSRFVSPSATLSPANPSLNEETPLPPAIDGVFASLERLGEAGLAREEVDEILADARFVAPLPNGQVAELLPGGENHGRRFAQVYLDYKQSDTPLSYTLEYMGFERFAKAATYNIISRNATKYPGYELHVEVVT